MKLTVRPKLKLALTLFFVLAVYFHAISNPFSRFDDTFIVNYYGVNSNISFLDVITPGSSFYYRPLVNLSYWLDFRLWGMDPTFMHLENIVFHLVNVLLVYLIASLLPINSKVKSIPVFSALLFGLHPINSESVNWVAGRTDPLAGVFIFLAVYCLIRAIKGQSIRFAFLSFCVAFIGMLTKETAVMFIPAAFLIITNWPVVAQELSWYRAWRLRLRILIVISLCLFTALMIMGYMRRHGDSAISMIFDSSTNIVIRALEAFGFYVKKIFLPLPLNAAILQVHPLYVFVGIISLVVVIVTFRRIGIPGIFLALAVLFTLPALIVAATPIAWTPFGERYLYIPSAFAVMSFLELSHCYLEKRQAVNWYVPVVSIVVVIACITTVQRGMLWGNNFALIEDIITKSPNFGVARNEYGVLLKQTGRYDEAQKQFEIAGKQHNKPNVERVIRLNLIGMKVLGKQEAEVKQILLSEVGNKADGDVELLKLIKKYDEIMLVKAVSFEQKRKIIVDIIETNEILYRKTRDPFYLYRSGQLALTIENNQNAATYFRKAYENAHPDVFYRESARRLAEQLGAK